MFCMGLVRSHEKYDVFRRTVNNFLKVYVHCRAYILLAGLTGTNAPRLLFAKVNIRRALYSTVSRE